ncbi:VOC family protein [Desulfosarcina sp.]|uniref:VOC family protein n=1 Tax=Desulfosarcina sp. TaxID=2027861 RepID=UPI0035694492
MTYRFHHIHLLCTNLENTIDFFTQAFGAELVARKQFGQANGASLSLNGTTINLRVAAEDETVNADAPLPIYGYHHMCVEVDNLDAAYRELRDKKIECSVPPRNTPDNLRVAFFKGPDDIVIEVLQQL